VRAGDPLYRVDPWPFEIDVQSSEATLAKAEATLKHAVRHAMRIAYLAKERAAPEAENDNRAALERAKLNLEYTTVRAPIDGVVGAALVSEEKAAMNKVRRWLCPDIMVGLVAHS
jgi:membrane fusion protein (multidrug efflux system)